MARVRTKAEARKQVLRNKMRELEADLGLAVVQDVNAASVNEMRAVCRQHLFSPETTDDQLDQCLCDDMDEYIVDHAQRNGLIVTASDLWDAGNLPTSQAPQDTTMDLADQIAQEMSDTLPEEPKSDEATDTLASMIGDIASGPEGYARATETLRELIKKAQRRAGSASVKTVEPNASIGRTGLVDAFQQIPELSKAREGVKGAVEIPVYNNAPVHVSGYVWPTGTVPALTMLAEGKPVFMHGPAGTGKTSFAKELAAAFGRPFIRVSCHDQTEGPTLAGMTVPEGDGVSWRDGALVAAIRCHGAVVLIDEPSVARPGALMVMQSLLDDERALVIEETGERVEIADDVMMLVADNTNGSGDLTGSYEGTRRLNRAFMDRFGVVLPVDYLPRKAEIAVIEDQTGASKELCGKIVSYASATRAAMGKGELIDPVSTRGAIRLATLMSKGFKPDVSFTLAIGSRANAEDAEPLRMLFQTQFASTDEDIF